MQISNPLALPAGASQLQQTQQPQATADASPPTQGQTGICNVQGSEGRAQQQQVLKEMGLNTPELSGAAQRYLDNLPPEARAQLG